MKRRLCMSLVSAGILSWSAQVGAFLFVATQMEFLTWPPYCQAKYSITDAGVGAGFANAVPASALQVAAATIGERTFEHVHHYCASLIYLSRARLEADPAVRRAQLRNATNEITYSFTRESVGSPLYASMAITFALIEEQLGRPDQAERYLGLAKASSPKDGRVYVAMAVMHRKGGRLPAARKVLEEGLAATEGASIEIAYNLGLVCLELRDLDCAESQARVVYARDYPFAGLRKGLEAQGRWRAGEE